MNQEFRGMDKKSLSEYTAGTYFRKNIRDSYFEHWEDPEVAERFYNAHTETDSTGEFVNGDIQEQWELFLLGWEARENFIAVEKRVDND